MPLSAPADGSETTVVLDRRFQGPPFGGNGGYVAGVTAASLNGPAAVRLEAPPPLERPLTLEPADPAIGRRTAQLRDGDRVIATATPAGSLVPAAGPVRFDAAASCAECTVPVENHPFPHCFTCGPAREPGDGLRIFSAPTGTPGVLAATWVPDARSIGSDGVVPAPIVWAALDCPSYWAVGRPGEMALLGTITVDIWDEVRVGQRLVVVSWAGAREGRRLHAGSALYTAGGLVAAVAESVWIRVDEDRVIA